LHFPVPQEDQHEGDPEQLQGDHPSEQLHPPILLMRPRGALFWGWHSFSFRYIGIYSTERNMPSLEYIRAEIEHMRLQVGRQRKEILQLQRAGISTAAAELLLARMHTKIDGLCAERERLKKEDGCEIKGKVLGGRSW
jgi:hypothetical protein